MKILLLFSILVVTISGTEEKDPRVPVVAKETLSKSSVVCFLAEKLLLGVEEDHESEKISLNRRSQDLSSGKSESECLPYVKDRLDKLKFEYRELKKKSNPKKGKAFKYFMKNFCDYNYEYISEHCDDPNWAVLRCQTDSISAFNPYFRTPLYSNLIKYFFQTNDHTSKEKKVVIKESNFCRNQASKTDYSKKRESIRVKLLKEFGVEKDITCDEYTALQIKIMNKECRSRVYFNCMTSKFRKYCAKNNMESFLHGEF